MLSPEARTRRALFVTKAGQCKKETGLAVLVGRRAGLTVLGFEDFSGDLGLEFCMAGSRVFREIWVANSAWCRGSVGVRRMGFARGLGAVGGVDRRGVSWTR